MQALRLKLPPPFLALLLAPAMWGLASLPPALGMPGSVRWALAIAFAVAAAVFDVPALLAFRRSRTTVDPLRPHRAQTLVIGGVYQLSRNPMYVGLLLMLVAWAVFLDALWPFVAPVLFVFYVNRFQIEPEEKALAQLFGAEYSTYCARVPRWL